MHLRTRVMLAAVAGVIGWSALSPTGGGRALADTPAVHSASPAAPETPPRLDPQSPEWRSDPACQMVFFAVLEGLYTDGVPDEAVNLIVPPGAGKEGVTHSFVFKCPLCHAAYEAFVAYQNRPAFNGSGEARSTFGKSFDPKVTDQLRAKDVRTRVYAMGTLIRPWLERRMTMMNMGAKDQEALLKRVLEYARQGDALFREYRGDAKSVYHEWMFYGGCQACEAAQTVAQQMKK